MMDNGPPLQAPSSVDDETLAAAVVRGARSAKWYALVACFVLGAVAVLVGWLVEAHRILLISAGIAVATFGAGAAADRILTDERSSGDPDWVLVAGFSVIRGVSILVGVSAAIIAVAWVFFRFLDGSRLTWH